MRLPRCKSKPINSISLDCKFPAIDINQSAWFLHITGSVGDWDGLISESTHSLAGEHIWLRDVPKFGPSGVQFAFQVRDSYGNLSQNCSPKFIGFQ